MLGRFVPLAERDSMNTPTTNAQSMLICNVCGKENGIGVRYCVECGTTLTLENQSSKKKSKMRRKPSDATFFDFVRTSLVLLLSLVAVLTLFLPIVADSVERDYDIEVKYSFIDSVQMFFASLRRLDPKDIEETALYERFEDLEIDFFDEFEDAEEFDDLSPKGKRTASKLFKMNVRLKMMSEDFGLSVYAVVAFAVSALYLVLCVLAFVFATLSFVHLLLGSKKLARAATKLTFFACFFSLPFCFANTLFFTLTDDTAKKMGLGMWILLIAAAVATVYLLAERAVRFPKAILNRQAIVRVLASAFTIVLVIFAFLPMATSKVRLTANNKDSAARYQLSHTVFDLVVYDVTEERAEKYSDMSTSDVRKNVAYRIDNAEYLFSASEIRKGEADYFVEAAMLDLHLGVGDDDVSMRIVPILLTFCVLLAFTAGVSMIFVQLNWFLYGEHSRALNITCKIVALLMTLGALGLVIGFVTWGNYNYYYLDFERIFKDSIAVAPIIMSCCALIAMCIPLRAANVCTVRDVSSAPQSDSGADAQETEA